MNYISNIEIKNFKSIRHQVIDGCKRINVFIGYPNVGKSNILEALGLFSCLLLKDQRFLFNDICRVRNFNELFFNGEYKEPVSVRVNSDLAFYLNINSTADLNLQIDSKLNASVEIVFSATVQSGSFVISPLREIIYSDIKHITGLVRKYDFRDNIAINQNRPLELSVPFGNNLVDVLQRESKLRKELVDMFDSYGLKPLVDRGDQSIKFIKDLHDGSAVFIPYHQIADTLRRLIFFKAAIGTNSNSILLFEEPEAHMFPPYIRKLTTDIIFDQTNQYFIATHSPYVLDALLEDAPHDISVYLTYYENGETRVKLMETEDIDEVRNYGVDLFFNLESYLKDGKVDNA